MAIELTTLSRVPPTTAPARTLADHHASLFGKILLLGTSGDLAADARHSALGLFVSLAGGRRARIVILAQSDHARAGDLELFSSALRKHGAKRVDIADLPTTCVDQMNLGSAVPQATGFLFIGRDANAMLASLAGSVLLSTIRSRFQYGAVAAGFQAGAAILGGGVLSASPSISLQGHGQPAVRKGFVTILPGLGFLPDWIIDPEFARSRSLDNLLASVAVNPALMGIGIAEGAGILANHRGQITSLGGGMAVVLDGREASSDYAERRWGEVVSVAGPRLFVLGDAKRFDPLTRAIPFMLAND